MVENNIEEQEMEKLINQCLENIYYEIGRIASVWSMLEFNIDQLIWKLLDVEQTLGACITTQIMGIAPRIRSLKALLEVFRAPKHFIKKINKFSDKIIPMQEERNRLIHDPWFINNERPVQIRKAIIKNEIVYKTLVIDVEKIKEIYNKTLALLKEFNGYINEIQNEPSLTSCKKVQKDILRAPLRSDIQSYLNSNL